VATPKLMLDSTDSKRCDVRALTAPTYAVGLSAPEIYEASWARIREAMVMYLRPAS
jgi:hypothetical protein